MSIRWAEGFENYGAIHGTSESYAVQGVWANFGFTIVDIDDTPTIQIRTGKRSARFTGPDLNIRRSLGGDFTTVGLAMAVWVSNLPSAQHGNFLMEFRDSGNNVQLGLQLGTTGRLRLIRGRVDTGILIAESDFELTAQSWEHIEAKIVMGATGSVVVKVNEREFINVPSTNTVGPGTVDGNIAQIATGHHTGWGLEISTSYYDDYVAWVDDTIGQCDFVGMQGVYYLEPIADDTPQQWSLTSGSNAYQLVDGTIPDDDLDYVYTDTIGQKTTYEVEALPANVISVMAVIPEIRARKSDTGECNIAIAVVSRGTEDEADDRPVTTGYVYYYDVFEQDPDTLAAWDPLTMPLIRAHKTA